MATQIKLRRDTAANWSVENPILAEGEPGLDTTNNILKIGNGIDTWTALPSIYDPSTNIIPSADNTYDLGSPAKQWRHVYTAGGSIYLDNIKLTNNAGKLEITKVINPGEETEEPDPIDSNAGDSVTSKLTNGSHEFKLESDGTLSLDGDLFTGGGGSNGLAYVWNVNSTKYVITAQYRDTETETYWIQVAGDQIVYEVGNLIDGGHDCRFRLFNDNEGLFRVKSGDITTENNVTTIPLADLADNNYVGSTVSVVGGFNNVTELTNGNNIQFALVNGRIEVAGRQPVASSGTFSTLPDFLDFVSGTTLKVGQNSQGLFFSGDANGGESDNDGVGSYPVVTNFTIPGNTAVVVTLDMVVNDFCSDFSVCVFEDGTLPMFDWGPDPTRIAGEYNCVGPTIRGLTGGSDSEFDLPNPGTYRVRFTYQPGVNPDVILETLDTDNNVLDRIEYAESLDTSKEYRIGFTADQDAGNKRTYIKNLTIAVNGSNTYVDSLQTSGTLVLPTLSNTGYTYNYGLNGPTLQLGDSQHQTIITGAETTESHASAQRIVIQGQRGYGTWGQNIAGEGGDVYIWGGVGGESDNGGGGSGGDIKIRGGQGQNNAGGYVKIEGGSAAGWNNSPTGGYVEIRGGNAVEGGNGDGGDVNIYGGAGRGSGNNGVVWVRTGQNSEHQWQFDNGGVLHLPTGGDIVDSNGTSVLGGGTPAQLVGDGYASGQGTKRVVYTNFAGYQGGEPTSLVVKDSDVVGISVGDSITFRNGEVRLITGISPWNNPNTQVITWTDSVNGGEMNPRYPVTLTTANYTEETKLTARIKPDLSTEGSGQYMDVYIGGAAVLDNKHVHMKGHDADTELFLGSDSNFVSAKDAGASPARVNLKSENDITVSETNLRMTRGSTWAVVYGDGKNRNFHNNTYDLTWNTITSDDQGNFYVGGEAASYAEAMVAKYGPDGDLIWKKMVNGNDTQGWQVDGVAYNPVDREVAFAVQTNYDKDHDYYKLTVFDSETGVIKTTTDVYDNDGNVNARALTWHPTLGYVLVGDTSGEVATTGNIRTAYESMVNLTTYGGSAPSELFVNDIGTVPSVGDYFEYNTGSWDVIGVNTYSGYYGLVVPGIVNFGDTGGGNSVVLHHNSKSGVGIIELPRESVKINGFYPSIFSNWRINGTNVTDQELQYGVGLYQNVPVINLTNPSDTGLTVGISIDYSGNYYNYVTTNTSGSGVWAYNDDFKILGSNLGGVDGGTVGVFNQVTNNGGTAYFSQASYPTLDVDVTPGTFARFQNNAEGTVSLVSDAGDGNWAVDVTMNQGQSMALGNVIFYHGNDIVGKVSDLNGIQLGYVGTPSLTSNYRIDMGYFMGYSGTDFTGGTFSISTPLNNRAYVWTKNWSKTYNPTVGAGYSYGRSVAVDNTTGDIVVGGYDNTVARGFVWKLNSSGATQWVKGFTNENGYNVTSLAVSKMNGTIYFTTDFDSLNVFTSAGTLLKRIQTNGPFGFNGSRVELEQQLDGEEYLYWGGNFGSWWTSRAGFLVSKLNSSLETVWSRSIRNSNSDFYTNYDQALDCVALGRGNIVAVGYSYAMSEDNYNGILASISTTDNFDAQVKDGWYVETPGGFVGYTDSTGDYTVLDLLDEGGSAANSTLANSTGADVLSWNNWSWKSVVVNLNKTDNGIAGVESIKFADGGKLDHNPSDIPPAVTDFHHEGWNYTLKLSDRGRFIINQQIPNDSYAQDLYITVPSNMNVAFPVGSVITLINTNDSNNNGYRIYVQPEYYNDYGGDLSPKIWAAGTGNYNPSTWSFQGLQTATLMKIGSNEWILTANNIQNED